MQVQEPVVVAADRRIREATMEDARRLAEIKWAAWQAAYAELIPSEQLVALTIEQLEDELRKELSNLLSRSRTLIVEDDEGAVKGYVTCGGTRQSGFNSCITGEIWAMYVDPPAQGVGFGSALMKRALECLWKEGYVECLLWTMVQNTRARGFYECFDFRAQGAPKVKVVSGIPALEIMYIRSL